MEVEQDEAFLPWANLYRTYKGINLSRAENDRKFRSWTGVAPEVAEAIFVKYQHPQCLPDRTTLLIVLNFLKNMPTEDNGLLSFILRAETPIERSCGPH
jgi:hypothetical protein